VGSIPGRSTIGAGLVGQVRLGPCIHGTVPSGSWLPVHRSSLPASGGRNYRSRSPRRAGLVTAFFFAGNLERCRGAASSWRPSVETGNITSWGPAGCVLYFATRGRDHVFSLPTCWSTSRGINIASSSRVLKLHSSKNRCEPLLGCQGGAAHPTAPHSRSSLGGLQARQATNAEWCRRGEVQMTKCTC
jgi:hypothetical protein